MIYDTNNVDILNKNSSCMTGQVSCLRSEEVAFNLFMRYGAISVHIKYPKYPSTSSILTNKTII